MNLRKVPFVLAATLGLPACTVRGSQATQNPIPAAAIHPTSNTARQGDALAAAIGLPILRESPPTRGGRELRIVYNSTVMVRHALPVLRLVEMHGKLTGELYLYWSVQTDSAGRPLRMPWSRNSCLEVRSVEKGIAYCEMPSWYVSWKAVADSLDKLGVWRLLAHGAVAGSSRPAASDQDDVFVEGIEKGHYGSVDYYAPARIGDSTSKVLRALAAIVTQLTRGPGF